MMASTPAASLWAVHSERETRARPLLVQMNVIERRAAHNCGNEHIHNISSYATPKFRLSPYLIPNQSNFGGRTHIKSSY